MSKNVLELTQKDIESGILSKQETGKSHSKQVNTQYDGTKNGLSTFAKSHNDNFFEFEELIQQTQELCYEVINFHLESTKLSKVNPCYKGTRFTLSDAYYIEGDRLCYFSLKTLSSEIEASRKYEATNKRWLVESMKRHKSGEKQPPEVKLHKSPFTQSSLMNLFKAEHDSFVALAGKLLWESHFMLDDTLKINDRLRRAVIFGENKKLFEVYARIARKQSSRARGRERNVNAKEVIANLVKQNPDAIAKSLWMPFLSEMLSEPQVDENGNEFCIYLDDKTNTEKKMTFRTFENNVSSAKKTLRQNSLSQ